MILFLTLLAWLLTGVVTTALLVRYVEGFSPEGDGGVCLVYVLLGPIGFCIVVPQILPWQRLFVLVGRFFARFER